MTKEQLNEFLAAIQAAENVMKAAGLMAAFEDKNALAMYRALQDARKAARAQVAA